MSREIPQSTLKESNKREFIATVWWSTEGLKLRGCSHGVDYLIISSDTDTDYIKGYLKPNSTLTKMQEIQTPGDYETWRFRCGNGSNSEAYTDRASLEEAIKRFRAAAAKLLKDMV